MKHFWYVPLLLQALVGPSSERCNGLEGDARTRCEAQVRDELNQPPPAPPVLESAPPPALKSAPLPPLTQPGEQLVPRFRTGQEFDSNRSFTGQEEGTPGY
jgi:hypothetical protein